MTVPANPPVEQYWSVTAYDRQTHALVRNMSRASRSSQIADMQKNTDGSVDVYLGPAAPAGKEANWIPTDPKRPSNSCSAPMRRQKHSSKRHGSCPMSKS